MNNMYWDNPAQEGDMFNIPEQEVMWQNMIQIPYEVRNPDRNAADGGPNGLPLNAIFNRPSDESANNENIRNEEVDVPNYDDWFANQYLFLLDGTNFSEEQKETAEAYAAYYNSVLTMREYHGWKWQKFVCGCGSRRPNCGRTTVEEGDPDGPNFQWFLSNINVRDPQHPAYRLRDDHYWIRLSILCRDDDGNTSPCICPMCKPVEQTLYNEIGPDVVTRCENSEGHDENVENNINFSGVPFENHWAQYFWTHPEVVIDGVGEHTHRFSEMYSFNTPTNLLRYGEPKQCDNEGRVPWDPNFRVEDILTDPENRDYGSILWTIETGSIRDRNGDQEDVGELDNGVLTLTTGYQTGQRTHEQLNLHYTDVQNLWNSQHPRGPLMNNYSCDICGLTVVILHNEGDGSTQPLWDDYDWYSMPNNDTICQECRDERTAVCNNCDETFEIVGSPVYDGDEIYCDEDCAAEAREARSSSEETGQEGGKRRKKKTQKKKRRKKKTRGRKKRKGSRKKRKKRKKSTRRRKGGAPKFLCGPDIDFVPEVHFNELESILDKLKEDTAGTALEEIVDELPSIKRDKKSGKCIGCKKLIDELVKNTMPSFVGPKILPIETDKILWLQQFTGVHKSGMCAVMGGRNKKKTRRRKGGVILGRKLEELEVGKEYYVLYLGNGHYTKFEEMEEIETGAGKMKKYKFRLRDPSFRWPSGVLTITKELVDPSAYTIREILGDVTSSTMGAETNADLGDDGSSSVTEILPLDRNDNMSVDTSVTELLSSVDELE